MLEPLIFEDNRGAVLADEHRKKTGHKIKQTMIVEKSFNRQGRINKDYISTYKCEECDFISKAGRRTREL